MTHTSAPLTQTTALTPSVSLMNYPAPLPELESLFVTTQGLKDRINSLKARQDGLWDTVVNRLRTDWTYHSNGIEGSTLSRGETHFFLSEGLTAAGKPFKDFLDAQNHAEAIDLLFEVVANKRPISEALIKETNALLLRGVEFTPAKNARGERVHKKAHPGVYKVQPNHVEQADGTVHHYVEPLHVPTEMADLLAWINRMIDQLHPIHVAAVAHYNMVRIHPFDDGNGRGARILMNLILLHKGYFPAVVRLETKPAYLLALGQADRGDLKPFIAFVANTLIATTQDVLHVLETTNVHK